MSPIDLVLLILLLVTGLVVVVAVLLQHGKSHGLSGTIAGGAETFFGKEKGGKLDRILPKVTTVAAIIFVVLVLVVYFKQEDFVYNPGNDSPVGMIFKLF